MDKVQLTVLGTPALRRGTHSISLARAKGMALLIYLAITRVAQPRERVLDLLWPESLPQAARKNMRNTLWTIREALGDDVLEQEGTTLQLSGAVEVDVHRLEDGLLLFEGGSIGELEAAAAHYSGPLADGLIVHEAPEFETWLTLERERVAAIYMRLVERIITLAGAEGNWQVVIDHAQRALAVDPLREPLYLAIIEAQMRQGRRAQAAQQYAALVAILQRELDVTPLPETTARYEALLAGAPQAAKRVSPTRHLSAAVAEPFVGRRAERAALDAARNRAAQNNAQVVLITGDLGMGKSRLWRVWADDLPSEVVVLTTHALQTDQPVPFGPLLTLFRQPGGAQRIVEPSTPLPPIWLAELTRLLPEIAPAWPQIPAPLTVGPAEERARLFQALTEALRLLADPLLVLVIDDLHWADPSTLDWLVYLVDQLGATPLLLIGTVRLHDASEQLTTIITGWQRQGRLDQIALGPLTADEGHALLDALRASPDGAWHEHWVRQSGGNPYFLTELSRSSGDGTPSTLASLVRARMRATVPDHAFQVLQAAAVLGDGGDLAVLRATSGRTEEETLDALDALVEAAVLADQQGVYHFIHPLVAAVVLQDMTGARLAFLHRRAAQALERVNSQHLERVAPQLMEHYAAAGDFGRAADFAEQAATQARAVAAFTESAAYARRALAWAPTPQRHLLLGEALSISGSAAAAQTELEAALQGFEQAADGVGITSARVLLAGMAISSSQPDVARTWLACAPFQQIQNHDPALAVQTYMLAAGVERLSQAYDVAGTYLDAAMQLIETYNLPELACHIAFERGNLLANRGDLHAAIATFDTAQQHAHSAGDLFAETMALNNLAYHSMLVGDLQRAQQTIQAAMELADQMALSLFWQYLHSTHGEIALADGRLDVANDAFVRAYTVAQSGGNQVHMANVRINQALVAEAQHDHPRARALIAEAQTLFGDAIDPFVRDKIARVAATIPS